MKTNEVAQKLVEYCRAGEFEKAYDELYDNNAVAIEPDGTPQPRTEGIQNLKEKNRQWGEDMQEMHSMKISDPIAADNFFTCAMTMDMTSKSRGRMNMEEICLYEVNDAGKIVREQFFYSM